MPHLTLPINPMGAMVQVGIGASKARVAALHNAGKDAPLPVPGWALIDTGASRTAVDLRIIKELGLDPTGAGLVHTPTTGKTPAWTPMYDVSVFLYDQSDNYLVDRPIAVTGNDLSDCGCDVLLGMDLLKTCLFIYDGRANTFSLAF